MIIGISMSGLISFLIIVFCVWSLIKKSNRQAKGGSKRAVENTVKSGVNPEMPVKVKSGLKSNTNGKVSETLHDDRTGDWLACQLKEERNSLYKMRDMFGFKMDGRSITDAELLKEFHMGHCDSGAVDKAAGK